MHTSRQGKGTSSSSLCGAMTLPATLQTAFSCSCRAFSTAAASLLLVAPAVPARAEGQPCNA